MVAANSNIIHIILIHQKFLTRRNTELSQEVEQSNPESRQT
jgi:hypothetical protein